MAFPLETDRLFLKPLAPADFEAHAAMMADVRVAEFLTMDRKPPSREAAWRAFAAMLGHREFRGFTFFSVFEKASGAWVGRVGPWMPEGWPGLECGWAIAPAHWGKGYAGEAASAAVGWLFETRPDLPRVISLIDPRNKNSQAVARKIGETKTGAVFNHELAGALDIWTVTRDEWRARVR
jgi:RimJ/RimL family protein N-acetyltransferase